MTEQPPVDRRKQIEAELRRLKAKRAEVADRDIKAALDQVIQARQEELAAMGGAEGDEPVEPEELPEPPTPEQKADAEKLVQQARVEKMRGNAVKVAELIEQAAQTAPGSSELQEMLADELLEQRKYKEALAKFDLARRLDPKNVSVDKKHADLVFRTKAAAAGMELSHLEEFELASTAKYAGWLSIFIPGAGHCLMGKWTTGIIVFVIFVSTEVWIGVKHDDFTALIRTIFEARAAHPYSNAILIPLAVGVVNWIFGWGSCFSSAKSAAVIMATSSKSKIDHPTPPVNLPFE